MQFVFVEYVVMLSRLCYRVIQYNGAVLCRCECVVEYIILITCRPEMALNCFRMECSVLINSQFAAD